MRSEQDRRMGKGWRQQQSPESSDERFEGQYEKDPWRPDWRRDPPPRYLGTGFPGRGGPGFTGGYHGFGTGSLEPDWRAGRRQPLGEEGREPDPRRSERRYPPGPKGYQRSDERLREDISERLMEARYVDSSDVTVAVSGAKVVLEGTVPERRMKHAIEDLADACPGVQDIENGIRLRRE